MNEPLQTNGSAVFDVGVIHGRFQVLHNDHLKYLLAGKEKCAHLVVGITNPDPVLTQKEVSAPGRDDPAANPLTYYERQLLVRAVFREQGISPDAYSIVPFPVNFPDLYKYYVPMDAVFFLTIYDEWGKRKLGYFAGMGLATHVLWEVPPEKKGLSAAAIRMRMLEEASWTHLVPPAAARLLAEWNIGERLRHLTQQP
jgi:nicotinamide-nucleotide adenylyltransferase